MAERFSLLSPSYFHEYYSRLRFTVVSSHQQKAEVPTRQHDVDDEGDRQETAPYTNILRVVLVVQPVDSTH